MNTKEYIESGILEAFVLGSLPRQEAAQVQADISRYPELAAEVRVIEATMQQFAAAQAKEPPAFLQDKIWDSIQVNSAKTTGAMSNARPAPRIIPLSPGRQQKGMDWRYAAMIAMVIGSVALNFILWRQGRKQSEKSAALAAGMDTIKAEQARLAASVDDYRKAESMMADTGMQTIVMHTVVKGHAMAATLYLSKGNGDAYVAMNALPAPPAGMQYQLWVIQGSKPVSIGTLPNDMAGSPAMHKIAMQVTTGDAFAISLEKEGGSLAPTTVYVLGKA